MAIGVLICHKILWKVLKRLSMPQNLMGWLQVILPILIKEFKEIIMKIEFQLFWILINHKKDRMSLIGQNVLSLGFMMATGEVIVLTFWKIICIKLSPNNLASLQILCKLFKMAADWRKIHFWKWQIKDQELINLDPVQL
jgi:hypothetical protein